ncbi:tetratricopeptide repeat protein [Goodfellowiella coeruleoviolacea]|uniref:Tetratricopeptide repeat-containing protein n=1 Tax=Goodfellowiella coeruleoviolacea TaxID=334858 RepID=A0AAE3KIU5_9PSEU|nr:tetratricopeptide repeat protein [Goodfellowiella coeruleoviolacea]MCP2168845.1 Tetratricopeptide repeat-containing protein [Goodfellowiella coeruleoviolacea]
MHEDEPLTSRAEDLRHADRHAEAIEVLRAAVAAGECSAPRELAYALLGSDQPREALEVVKRAIRRGRTDLYSLLGSIASELDESRAAEDAYRKALGHGDLSALNDYGVFLRDEKRFVEAAEVLRRSADFGDVLAPSNLIHLYEDDLDDPETAIEVGEKYLAPDKPAVYTALAAAYAAVGRTGEAGELFQRAIELDAPRAHQKYAWFLWDHEEDLAACEREFWAAFDNDEEGWSYALGYFLVDRGRIDEARAVLEHGATWGDMNARELLAELETR